MSRFLKQITIRNLGLLAEFFAFLKQQMFNQISIKKKNWVSVFMKWDKCLILLCLDSYSFGVKQTQTENIPVSMFPIIVCSPNLAFFHMESEGIDPSTLSIPRKFHDLVVCRFIPLSWNTDKTFECSAWKRK